MWLDIIVFVVVILSMALGYRNGCIYSLLHGGGWIVSILAAFLLLPPLVNFFDIHAASGSVVRDMFVQRFEESLSSLNIGTDGSVPKAIMDYITKVVGNITGAAISGIATVSLSIALFVILLLVFKLLSMILINSFSKKSKLNLAGNLDGILGLASGGLKGVVIVFILLASILPVTLLISESARLFMEDALFSSIYTKNLYDNNLLLLLLNNAFNL